MAMNNTTVAAYAASLVISDHPAQLVRVTGYNSKGSAQFIQLHDAASLPADTAIPKCVITVTATANFTIDFAVEPRVFNAGIIVCNSSTGPTKTIGSADCWFDAQFI